MLDRASSLADREVLDLISTRFVPVAIDQHVHRVLKDAEGEWFAKILKEAGRGLGGRSQGNYLFSPDGKLLAFANTADAAHVKRLLATALKKFEPKAATTPTQAKASLPQFQPPAGGLVVKVTSKVLSGYEKGGNPSMKDSLGQDHMWLRQDEVKAIIQGDLPDSVAQRLCRFHLVDNTRGEPPSWRAEEVKKLDLALKDGKLVGTVHLETKSGDRGFKADVLGFIAAQDSKVTRFDVVAKGEFWGEGTFTRGAPPGRFPFAVAFALATGDSVANRIVPGAARGNLKGYLR